MSHYLKLNTNTIQLSLLKKRIPPLKIIITFFICSSFFLSCQTKKPKETLPATGNWHAELMLTEEAMLPFNFSFNEERTGLTITILNGEEEILLDQVYRKNDSIIASFPVFESVLKFKLIDKSSLEGEWINYYKGKNYKIRLVAYNGKSERFHTDNSPNTLSKTYSVTFSPETEDEYRAIGLFKQNGSIVTGTFATETGDYRHLEGVATKDSLFLSTFDGSHAFLFKAKITDSTLNGMFWSGKHFKENWRAKVNPNAKLRNADSLTFLKEGYKKLAFTFPNDLGEQISLTDSMFENKPVIIQIMGSWCPNCLDETNYFNSLYKKYNKRGLEIIAIAFERTSGKQKALENLKNLRAKTGVDYHFLLGGATRKDKAEEKLPMLNHIMSYPTSIFIDRKGKIRRIHTGFYGPSTGKYYESYTKETEDLVEDMLTMPNK